LIERRRVLTLREVSERGVLPSFAVKFIKLLWRGGSDPTTENLENKEGGVMRITPPSDFS
jgi:hypothetical protein